MKARSLFTFRFLEFFLERRCGHSGIAFTSPDLQLAKPRCLMIRRGTQGQFHFERVCHFAELAEIATGAL